MEEKNQYVRQVAEQKYEFGFTTDVHTEIIPVGLNEDIVRLISAKAPYRLSGYIVLCRSDGQQAQR